MSGSSATAVASMDDSSGNYNDSSFMLERCRQLCERQQIDEARAWLLVAAAVQPNSFDVLFESYLLDKRCLNAKQSAEHLEKLCAQFPDQPLLHNELCALIAALQLDGENGAQDKNDDAFLRQLFALLSHDVQRRALSVLADHCNDTLQHCKFVLLLTKQFPTMLNGHASRVIEMLVTTEQTRFGDNALNVLRKALVVDVAPSILSSRAHSLCRAHLHMLFLKTVQFYTLLFMSDSCKLMDETGGSVECRVADVWTDMMQACAIISSALDWQLTDVFSHKRSRELMLQQLNSFNNTMQHATCNTSNIADQSENVRQLVYCTVAVLIMCVAEYMSFMRRPPPLSLHHHQQQQLLSNSTQECLARAPLIMVEAFVSATEPWHDLSSTPSSGAGGNLPRTTHNRTSSGALYSSSCSATAVVVTVSGQCATQQQHHTAVNMFVTAVQCHQLLCTSQPLLSELQSVWQCVDLSNTDWFRSFLLDARVYSGDAAAVADALRRTSTHAAVSGAIRPDTAAVQLCRHTLLQAHLALSSGDHSTCVQLCSRLLSSHHLPELTGCASRVQLTATLSHHRRHVHLLCYCRSDVIAYGLTLVCRALQHRVLGSARDVTSDVIVGGGGGDVTDIAIGHLIVLLQLDWPSSTDVFNMVLQLIIARGSLVYPQFVQYITCADIIEQFVALSRSTATAGGVKLVLLPSQQTRQRMMSTRGVDKGAREEFRATMASLVRQDPINQPLTDTAPANTMHKLLLCFIEAEIGSLLHCF